MGGNFSKGLHCVAVAETNVTNYPAVNHRDDMAMKCYHRHTKWMTFSQSTGNYWQSFNVIETRAAKHLSQCSLACVSNRWCLTANYNSSSHKCTMMTEDSQSGTPTNLTPNLV